MSWGRGQTRRFRRPSMVRPGPGPRRLTVTLQVTILCAFLLLLSLTTLAISWRTYRHTETAISDLSRAMIEHVSEVAIDKVENLLRPASGLVEASARLVEGGLLSFDDKDGMERYTREMLARHRELAMLYVGGEDGVYVAATRLRDGTTQSDIIDRRHGTHVTRRRDAEGALLSTTSVGRLEDDPWGRPWYRQAMDADGLRWTDVYVLSSERRPGLTASCPMRAPDGRFVGAFGADIELGELALFLRGLRVTERGVTLIVNGRGEGGGLLGACGDDAQARAGGPPGESDGHRHRLGPRGLPAGSRGGDGALCV